MHSAKEEPYTMNCFDQQKPTFVSVKDLSFSVGQVSSNYLHVLIKKIQPIRKYFKDRKLLCYSMDAKVSQTKKYCVFCDDAYRCQRKLRLSMILIENLEPIVFDLNLHSFENLQQFIDHRKDDIQNTPVTLKVVYDQEDRRSIEFTPDDI